MTKTGIAVLPLLLLCVSLNAGARSYIGQGYGVTLEQARSSAQAALSETLWVEIKSEISSVTDNDGSSQARQQLNSYSELPLLGAASDCMPRPSGEYYCEVVLDSDQAERRYRAEIEALVQQLQRRHGDFERGISDQRVKHRWLTDMLLMDQKLQQLQRVMTLLNPAYKSGTGIDSASLRQQQLELESSITDLQIAAKVIARQLPQKKYFILPAVPQGSSQATQLGQVIRDHLSNQLSSVSDALKADATLKGHYQETDAGVVLTYQAYDSNGSIVASPVVQLSSSAYQGLTVEAASVDFEQLLNQGYIVSNEFRAELNSNHGKQNLLFETGEEIELFVKLNQPGYFYIVSHNAAQNLSYLLELSSAPGRRAFVSYVNADDANRWISLGRFEVVPPFGTEHLQLIASNIDLVDKLPATRYDTEQQLYILVSQNSKDAVIQTRALKPKRKQHQQSAESALTYTTAKAGQK